MSALPELQERQAQPYAAIDVHEDVWVARLKSCLTDPEQSPGPATRLTELACKLRDS